MLGGLFHSLVDKESEIPKALGLNCQVRGVVSLEINELAFGTDGISTFCAHLLRLQLKLL